MPWIVVTIITLISSLIVSLIFIIWMIWHLHFGVGYFFGVVFGLLYSAIEVYLFVVVWSYRFLEILKFYNDFLQLKSIQMKFCAKSIQGVFFNRQSPNISKYEKPRLGEFTLTLIVPDSLDQVWISFFVHSFRGRLLRKAPCK